MDYLKQHEVIVIVLCYVFYTALASLPTPEQKFEFYPWFYHTVQQCLSQVPARYRPRQAEADPNARRTLDGASS